MQGSARTFTGLDAVRKHAMSEREAQTNTHPKWLTWRLMSDFKRVARFRHNNGRADKGQD
ncbi:hypothetical protein C9I56_05275 [Paraburkholderia caribensis]|nr:hypothetical protein C9I56_05275 [Paraburkholderia caribensis]